MAVSSASTEHCDEKLDEIEDILSKWDYRDLSLFGRIQIIKPFAVSKIVLSAS